MSMRVTHENQPSTTLKCFNTLFYYICDSPSRFRAIPLHSSCVLALQNQYLGPAIITRGFIFFIFIAYRKLKLNYAKAFLTFDPLISFFISPTVQLRLIPNLSQALTCLCSTPRTNFVIKTTNATSKD